MKPIKTEKITNGFQAETIINGPIDKVYDYWFHPLQIVPPLKKIIELNYHLGGTCKLLCYGINKEDVLVDCVFRNLLTNKELVYEWSTTRITCVVSNSYFVDDNKTTKIICEQVVMRGHEFTEQANHFTLGYLAAMQAIFERLKENKEKNG